MILQRSLALLAICASAWLVTACGGGDDRSTSSPTDSANIAPTVELSGPSQVVEGDDVLVSASADDPDGTITRFDWTVSRGTVAPQSPSSTRHEYRFRAPDVSQPETIELTATVVDDAGASASAVYNVTVLDNDDPAEAPEVSAGADRSGTSFQDKAFRLSVLQVMERGRPKELASAELNLAAFATCGGGIDRVLLAEAAEIQLHARHGQPHAGRGQFHR